MDELDFYKLQALGNDFVVLDRRSGKLSLSAAQIRRIADRRHGVGCDQLLCLEPSERADVFMRIYNADGSEVGACGNGTRAVARLVMEERGGNRALIETAAGVLTVTAGVQGYTVDMGRPRFGWDEIPLARPMDTSALDLARGPLKAPAAVNLGNPHAVFFVADVEAVPLAELGPALETDPLVPRARQHRGCGGTGSARDPAAGVGARRRPDAGLRQRRLRGAGRGGAARPLRARGGGPARRRHAADRLERRRPGLDDRPGKPQLQGATRSGAAGRDVMTAPAERAPPRSDRPEVITFGCRLNTLESEVMRCQAQAQGLDDVVIVHTCAVTAEAERQARQAIRRARRERPTARILVTGCSAQIKPASYAAMAEVDRVIGNAEKLRPALWQSLARPGAAPARVMVADIMAIRETAGHLIEGLHGRARAFLQVQNGCDHRCTFCIIPYGRGPSRSVPAGEVVRQARHLVAAGYREIVLTGVDLTSYGKDLPGQPTLGLLARRLLRLVPELEAAAPVVARPGRDRPRPARAGRRRAAADAASAPQRPGGRRSDPEAHEAPAQPRGRGPPRGPAARACAPGSRSAPT